MQIFIYCKATLYVSGVTAPIIRSTKNCNCSLRYRSYRNIGAATSLQRGHIGPRWREGADQYYDLYRRLRLQFLVLLMMGVVTPETCKVILQLINICILLQLVGFLLILNYDARNHELKK